MKLDEYIQYERACLEKFEKHWKENNAEDAETFHIEPDWSLSDWMEQYSFFCEEEC